MLNLFQHPSLLRSDLAVARWTLKRVQGDGLEKKGAYHQRHAELVSASIFRHVPPVERLPCVYILASQPRGTLYIGVTSNLIGRLWQHRNGGTKGFVARYAVFLLVRFELCGDMNAAIAREKQLKRWHRQWKVNLIESDNPDWHDLAPALGFERHPAGLTRQSLRPRHDGC